MADIWSAVVRYLFQQPGVDFSYNTAFLVGIGLVVVWGGYHYVLEERRRFRHHEPVLHFLDSSLRWVAALAAITAIVLFARHTNAPVISWRIWLILTVIAWGVAYLLMLGRMYRRLPKALAAHDNELLKRSYLAPPNQKQVANASNRRPASTPRN